MYLKMYGVFFQSGVLKFCGPTKFASGIWAGIELDETAGKNDGSVSGVRYFTCQQKHGMVLIKLFVCCFDQFSV